MVKWLQNSLFFSFDCKKGVNFTDKNWLDLNILMELQGKKWIWGRRLVFCEQVNISNADTILPLFAIIVSLKLRDNSDALDHFAAGKFLYSIFKSREPNTVKWNTKSVWVSLWVTLRTVKIGFRCLLLLTIFHQAKLFFY